MYRISLVGLMLALALAFAPADEQAKGPVVAGKNAPLVPLVAGLKNPESVCIGPDGRTYVTTVGESGKDGDGAVMVVSKGKAEVFAGDLDDPRGIVRFGPHLYVADKTRIIRVDSKGKSEVFVAEKDFPHKPASLKDVEVDHQGNLHVSDSGNSREPGAIFKIPLRNNKGKIVPGKVTVLTDARREKALKAPHGLHVSSESHLFLIDFGSGVLSRVNLHDGSVKQLVAGLGGGNGIARDKFGRLYISDRKGGTLSVIPRPGERAVLLASGFQSAGDICLSADGKSILVPDTKYGAIYSVPCTVPGAEVDERALAVQIEPAFAELKWTDWKSVSDKGRPIVHRPIVLTHAGDGSNRVFVATQHGVIHSFANDPKAKQTKVFLDIQDRVIYQDSQNEEGFLGLAFAPDYKKTGYFYVYYTPRPSKRLKDEKLVNVVSRFRVSKDDPDRADPASEEILLRLKKPYWNHDGGTLVFGPDGMLYIAIGDGGAANDPHGHGQNLNSLLGKILRIDVSKKEGDLPYAIPKDNPFVGKKDQRGEIWAYGLRNVWRMAFDRKTGKLWAGDVGQNLWEEIDIITKGGNYGWNLREGLHPFGRNGVEPNGDMIEPIWEYHHDIGKSITGGNVYRGSAVKALEGLYLYADYVSGHIWALRYDDKLRRVTENHLLGRRTDIQAMSFGEDEKGEVYVLTATATGKGIFRFAPK